MSRKTKPSPKPVPKAARMWCHVSSDPRSGKAWLSPCCGCDTRGIAATFEKSAVKVFYPSEEWVIPVLILHADSPEARAVARVRKLERALRRASDQIGCCCMMSGDCCDDCARAKSQIDAALRRGGKK